MKASEFKPILEDLDTKTLEELKEILEEVILSRGDDSVLSFIFDQLRQDLQAKFKLVHQTEVFKPWKFQKKNKQEAFTKAWKLAVQYCKRRELEDSSTSILIRKLLVLSPMYEGHLTVDLVIKSLQNIDAVFENQFPGYSAQEIKLVCELLK